VLREATYADGHPERLAGLAAVLARVPYDLVVASGSDAGNEPARLTHLDDGDQRAVRLKRRKGSA
jgi:hypothetical protein